MTHLERDGAPAVLWAGTEPPGPRAVWCGARIEYVWLALQYPPVRHTNTTTDPRHADCPECWAAVRRAREGVVP